MTNEILYISKLGSNEKSYFLIKCNLQALNIKWQKGYCCEKTEVEFC